MIKKVINKQKRQKTNKQRLSPSKKKKKKTKLKISLNFFQRSISYGVYYDSVISKFFFYFHWILIMHQSPHPIAQATAAYLLSLSVISKFCVVWAFAYPWCQCSFLSWYNLTLLIKMWGTYSVKSGAIDVCESTFFYWIKFFLFWDLNKIYGHFYDHVCLQLALTDS